MLRQLSQLAFLWIFLSVSALGDSRCLDSFERIAGALTVIREARPLADESTFVSPFSFSSVSLSPLRGGGPVSSVVELPSFGSGDWKVGSGEGSVHLGRKIVRKVYLPEANNAAWENKVTNHLLSGSKSMPVLATEIVDGDSGPVLKMERRHETLKDALEQLSEDPKAMLIELVTSLRKVHEKGVIHGDLKPANISVSRRQKVAYIDWGFASVNGERTARLNGDDTVAFTPTHAPPEQLFEKLDFVHDVRAMQQVIRDVLLGKMISHPDMGPYRVRRQGSLGGFVYEYKPSIETLISRKNKVYYLYSLLPFHSAAELEEGLNRAKRYGDRVEDYVTEVAIPYLTRGNQSPMEKVASAKAVLSSREFLKGLRNLPIQKQISMMSVLENEELAKTDPTRPNVISLRGLSPFLYWDESPSIRR